MSDFDDQVMRDRLQRLGGSLPDENAAYAALQHRVRAAKRRRVVVGSSGLAAACVLAIVVANLPGRNHQTVTTATNDVTATDVSLPAPTSTTEPTPASTPTTTATTTPADSTATGMPSSTTVTKEPSVPSIVQPITPASGASTGAPAGNNPPSNTAGAQGTTAPTPSPAPTTSPTPSAPETEPTDTGPSTPPAPLVEEARTFAAAHGSITVRLDNGQLTLVDQHADDGYTFQLDRNDPDRIRVRFRSDQATSQIDVFISAGHIAGTIEEQSSSPAGIAPSSTTTTDSTSDGPGHN